MPAVYLYAIADRPEAPLPSSRGLQGASLSSLACGDLAAVFSPLTATDVQATESALWLHEEVVEALMAERAVLPVRFGSVFSNEAAVRAELMARYTALVAALDRVRGRVELGLRVLWDDDQEAIRKKWEITDRAQRSSRAPRALSPGDGRSYLMTRLEEERRAQARRQRAEALAAEIHTPLTRLAVASARQVLITPRLLLTGAYLLEHDRVAAFRREVEMLSAAHSVLRFLCTGPWPPYSFADV